MNEKIRLPLTPVVEFKGEESVREWELAFESIVIGMLTATDKRGLLICRDSDLSHQSALCAAFNHKVQYIRDNMNNDVGDPCTLIPRGH